MTKLQFTILKYINKEPSTKKQLCQKFHISEEQFDSLFQGEVRHYIEFSRKDPNSKKFYLNENGMEHIEAYQRNLNKFYLDSIYIPIFVSLGTTIVVLVIYFILQQFIFQ